MAIKLYVMAGHGGTQDPSGAVGNGYQEAAVARQICGRVKALGGDAVGMLDPARNPFYTDFGGLGLPRGCQILEVHLDCYSDASAHGGHVIIKPGLKPDAYDAALGEFIASRFPGRAEKVRGQALHDANKASALGHAYRLLETCFISNADDMRLLMSDVDAVAKGILAAFGIGAVSQPGVGVQQYDVNYTPAQRWRVKDEGNGVYCFQSVARPDLWLDLQGNLGKSGQPVWVYPGNGSNAQKWRLDWREAGLGRYAVIHPHDHPRLSLDVAGGSQASQAAVRVWDDNGTGAQRWLLVPTGVPGEIYIVNANSLKALDVIGGGK